MQPPTDLLRQAAERRLVRAEQRIEPVVDAAVDAWVWALHDTLIRVAVRQHRSTAVTAAGNSRRRQRRRAARTMAHGRPLTPPTTPEQHTTVDAAVSAYNRWRHDLDNTILPTISITFGEAFQDLRRRTPGSDFRPQQEYMATVADRLRIWPDGAFDELRPELEEALSEAETIEQITDRVGRVLGIDAQTRALKAEINEVDAKLNDPQLHPWRRDALTARRRALWAAHDDAMQEWRWKARRIARTESHGAVQAGQLAAALQAQEETGETWYKRWLSTEDVRTRASHRVADGQMVPLTGQFRVGGFLLRHPGDPLVIAPHETINCRCSCTFLDPDAAQEALQGPDGSLGEIRPGGVRLGTDDPTAAAEAIREVAETEQRALPPDPDARGEDAGQPSPAPTPPVDAPDEQPIAPQVTDMSGLTDSDLLELMQDANRVGDDELYDAAVAEWDARSALDHSREDDTETPSSLSEPAGGPVETDAQFAGLDDAELIAVMNDAINADDDDLYRAAAAEWARREGLTSAGRVPAAYGEPIRGGRAPLRGRWTPMSR